MIPIGAELKECFGLCQENTFRVYEYHEQRYVYIVKKGTYQVLAFEDLTAEQRKTYERYRFDASQIKPKKKYVSGKPPRIIQEQTKPRIKPKTIKMRYPK